MTNKEKEKVEKLFGIAALLMPAFIEANKEALGEHRLGICLCIFPKDGDVNEPIPARILGSVPPERAKEKLVFAEEKIRRMRQNNYLTSFEDENESEKKFGGGIQTRSYFIAPSGFPPHLDQDFAILLANTVGDLNVSSYKEIRESTFRAVNKWKEVNGEQWLKLEEF